MASNFLYSLRDTIHRDLQLFRKMWEDAPHLDPLAFQLGLASMPIPCDGKWECEEVACDKFINLLDLPRDLNDNLRPRIGSVSMMETFIHHVRMLLRGTDNNEKMDRMGQHGARAKFDVLAVDMLNMDLMAAIFAVSDFAHQHSTEFHKFTKQPCPIYGWCV